MLLHLLRLHTVWQAPQESPAPEILQSLVIGDWLVLPEGGTFLAMAAIWGVALLVIHSNASGASCS